MPGGCRQIRPKSATRFSGDPVRTASSASAPRPWSIAAKPSECLAIESFPPQYAALDRRLFERLHILNCLLGLRPIAIVGIDIDRANDTPGIDDEPARHRQRPAVLAVANGEVIAEAQINLLQIVRQLEPKPELGRISVTVVGKQIEA